jgi:hypothetical protein
MKDIQRISDFMNGAFWGAVLAGAVLIGGYLTN